MESCKGRILKVYALQMEHTFLEYGFQCLFARVFTREHDWANNLRDYLNSLKHEVQVILIKCSFYLPKNLLRLSFECQSIQLQGDPGNDVPIFVSDRQMSRASVIKRD